MSEVHLSLPRYAFESLAHDAIFHLIVMKRAIRHRHTGSIFFGLTPLTSLFVVESYDYLSGLNAGFKNVLGLEHVPVIRSSRHRAKLFGSTASVVGQLLGTLRAIARTHAEYWNRDHTGFLGPLKRYVQPDLGLFTYDGHIVSTTHEAAYNFGDQLDSGTPLPIDGLGTFGHEFGYVTGRYVARLNEILGLQIPDQIIEQPVLHGDFVLKDVKSKALLSRGSIGTLDSDLAAAMVVLLAHVNYVKHVLRGLALTTSPTFFKIRFLAGYHAVVSFRILQSMARCRTPRERAANRVFKELIGNRESKWIFEQKKLRNMLVHYGPTRQTPGCPASGASFREAVEELSRGRTYEDIESTIDRFLDCTARTLEEGFQWSKNTFWYGEVKD